MSTPVKIRPHRKLQEMQSYKLSVELTDVGPTVYTLEELQAELLRVLHGELYLHVKNFKLEEVPE